MSLFNNSLVGTYYPTVHTSVPGQLNVVTVRPVSNKITFKFKPAFALAFTSTSLTNIVINKTPAFADGDYIQIDGFKFYFKTTPIFGEILIDNANQDVMSYNLFLLISNHPSLSILYNVNFWPNPSALEAARINLVSVAKAAAKADVFFNQINIYTPIVGYKLENSSGNDGVGFSFFTNKENWGAYMNIYVNTKFNTDATSIGYFKFPHDYNSLLRAPQLNEFSVIKLEKYLYDAEEIEFDISGVLKEFVKPTAPFLGLSSISRRCPQNICSFGVEYGEFYNIAGTRQYNLSDSRGVYSPITNSINISVHGDLVSSFACIGSLQTLKDQSSIDNLWQQYWKRTSISASVSALTVPLFAKSTHPSAREFLYFFLYNDNINNFFTVQYIFNFIDGTSLTYREPLTTLTLNNDEGGVYCAEVSAVNYSAIEIIQNSEIDNFSANIIVHAIANTYTPNELRVGGQNYKFVCDRCFPQYNQIVYLNKLGGYDTLWINGYTTLKKKIKTFEYDKFINYDNSEYLRADSQQFTNVSRDQYECNAGLFTREEYIFYADLFVSNDMYVSIDSADFVKCKLITSDFNLNSFEDMIELNFSIEILHDLNSISNNQK